MRRTQLLRWSAHLAPLLVITAVVIAGCTSHTSSSDDPWDQLWILEGIRTADGVIIDVRTPEIAEILFRPALGGNDGCDSFDGSYEYDDPTLTFPEIRYRYAEASRGPADCPDEYLPVVNAMRGALRDGVELRAFTPDTMVWSWKQGDTVLEFSSVPEG